MTDRPPPPRSLPDHAYRQLLLAYPRRFRDRFGVGMQYAFTRRYGDVQKSGPAHVTWFWLTTAAHVLFYGLSERLSEMGSHIPARASSAKQPQRHFLGSTMFTLKHAFRTLVKAPVVTGVATLSLALGIGANAAIFSVFDQFLLRSLPVQEPGRLVNLANPGPKPGSTSCNAAGGCDEVFSYRMFRDLEAQTTTSFAGIAAHRGFRANLVNNSRSATAMGMFVSGSYFGVLSMRPALGRLLGPEDDRTIAQHFVTVLGYDYWERELGRDPNVLNTTIVINGTSMTVVGVAARGFRGTTVGVTPDVFVPITMRGVMNTSFTGFDNRRSYWVYLFGRLNPTASIERGAAEINTEYRAILNGVEAQLQTGMNEQTMEQFRAKQIVVAKGRRGQSRIDDLAGPLVAFLFAITATVLLIACANIANLLLARGAGRTQEMAIRGALGASRRALVTQLLTESILLAGLGGLASLLTAQATIGLLASMVPPDESVWLAGTLRPSVFAFTAAISIGVGFLFGVYPAYHSTRPDLMSILKGSSGQTSGTRTAARFRTILVTSQITLSTVLLITAGLFIRNLDNVGRVELGVTTENVVAFSVSPIRSGYERADTQTLFERVEAELAAIPGVTMVSAASVPVFTGSSDWTRVSVAGAEQMADENTRVAYNVVGAGYFSTLGIPLIAGREFTNSDVADGQRVTIVNQAFAAKFGLDDRGAVGTMMGTSNDRAQRDILIVGVVRDAKYSSVKANVPPLFFTPYRQSGGLTSISFYARTAVDPNQILRTIPGLVRGIDANVPVQGLTTLEQQVRNNIQNDRYLRTLLIGFAALATVLAAIGLYGVLAYTVAQRTREFGLRMALGASGRRVRGIVLHQLGIMTAIGSVIGVAGGIGVGSALQSVLFGVEGSDPLVIGTVTALLAGIAIGAGYLPALRASSVDPMQALRYE